MELEEYKKIRKRKIQIIKDFSAYKINHYSNFELIYNSQEYHELFKDSIEEGFLQSKLVYRSTFEEIEFTIQNRNRLDLDKALNNFIFNTNKGLPELNFELYLYLINFGYSNRQDYYKGIYFLYYLRSFPSENLGELTTWAIENLNRKSELELTSHRWAMYKEGIFPYSEFRPSASFQIISDVESIPKFEFTKIEVDIFKNCIQIIRDNSEKEKGEIPKLLAKSTKGMTIENAKLFLVYLGLLGILLPEGKTPIFFPNSILECRETPMNAGKYYYYPYCLWQPKCGVNEEYLDFWFKNLLI